MAPHLPVEDPYDRGSLADRTLDYVRASPVLRIAFWVTALDHVAAVVLVALGRIQRIEAVGVFVLFSLLAWFFAVCMPVMNRTFRERLGAPEAGYWGEVVAMLGRVVVCVGAALYTAVIAYAVALGF